MDRSTPGRKALRLPWLRRMDYLPPWAAIAGGVVVGAAVGAVLTAGGSIAGAAVFVVVLGLAAGLAWSGEPIAVLEPSAEPPEVARVPPKPRKRVVPADDWVKIRAGTFLMGSPDDEEGRYDWEGPVHEVSISAFECLRCPVTRRLYKELIGEDPGWPEGEADERPVNNVRWFDAVRFCNKLSEAEELPPCYEIGEGGAVSWDPSADGYRLLTEAEWEYACRAGSKERWCFGDDEKQLADYAWHDGNSDNLPHPVGEKKPNDWGLADMHGNVYEWCWDWFGDYPADSQVDPVGPPDGDGRVVRGGSFADSPRLLRSAFRFWGGPEVRDWFFGFRCARSPRRQP